MQYNNKYPLGLECSSQEFLIIRNLALRDKLQAFSQSQNFKRSWGLPDNNHNWRCGNSLAAMPKFNFILALLCFQRLNLNNSIELNC